MATIKVGDVVQLKSGGPRMTVTSQHPDGDLRCEWFSDGKLSTAHLHPDTIDPIPKSADGRVGIDWLLQELGLDPTEVRKHAQKVGEVFKTKGPGPT
jgi:uncharacterized protein YodC (DUF2158 family)